jgi:perosamine synthetase
MTSRLAMFGGIPVIPSSQRHVEWPVITPDDEAAIRRALSSGKLTANTEGEQEVRGLEAEWAQFVGTKYAIAVSNGTAAIALALAAVGVEPGDEVLVPALSFTASALAPLHQLAIPVFVDINTCTFNMDPQQIEEKITPRTRAILPVHFHGLPADMDEIHALARKHHLFVIEDAAQAQGAMYKGHMTGSLSDMGAFSLNAQKNLPTCGEGGLMTTDNHELYEKAVMLRQFGEVIKDGEPRGYISQIMGWNYKLSSVLAAFTRSQLVRFPEYETARQHNISEFLHALSELPGLICPTAPHDRTHAWHILRFRFDPVVAGLEAVAPGRFRQAVRRALRAEGVPVSQYQLIPLAGHQVFQTQQGFGKGYPWALPGVPPQRYAIEDYPNTLMVIEDSLVLQRRHLNPFAGNLLKLYAEAFHKVWENLDTIAHVARSMPYEVPWQKVVTKTQKIVDRV